MLRRLALSLLFILPLVLIGCGPSKSAMEKEIKQGIEKKFNKTVTSISLRQVDANNYTGTAITEGGDVYDLTVKVKGQTYEWKATPDRAGIEKLFRAQLEQQLSKGNPGLTISSIEGTKDPASGDYDGVAVLSDGQRLKLEGRWAGETLNMKWKSE
jgi:hypothetical protein